MFKSSQEREAERLQREAELAEQARAAEEKRKRAAFLASPIGRASAAKQAGEQFFEVQLAVGKQAGSASFGMADGQHTTSSSAATLAEIEKLGWHLEHAGYFFMMTGETSTSRVFVSGEATAVTGVTMGVYLFRNADLARGTD